MALTIYKAQNAGEPNKGYLQHRDESESTTLEFSEFKFAMNADKTAATVYLYANKVTKLNVKNSTEKGAKPDYNVQSIPEGLEIVSFSVGKTDKGTNSEEALAKYLATLDPEKCYKGKLKLGTDPMWDMYLKDPDGDVNKIISFYFSLEECEVDKLKDIKCEFREQKSYSKGGYGGGQTEKSKLEDRLNFLNDQLKKAGQTPLNHVGEIPTGMQNPDFARVMEGFEIIRG